jgi:hypothetical protein
MRLKIACVTVLGLALASSAFGLESRLDRHAGRVHSFVPDQSVLFLEEAGAGGTVETITIDLRNAQIVRVRRDPADPWTWIEEPVHPGRLSVGTWVIVIGKTTESGVIQAARVEVPKIEGE